MMAEKNIVMQRKTATGYDTYHPETKAGNVRFADGTTVEAHKSETAPHGATSANTASRIVMRDASGNFSAGTITATLAGSADKVDNIHFQVSNGILQYNDGTGWKDVAISPIKSIQRGTHAGSTSDITITINTVNPAKCMVILNGHRIPGGDTNGYWPYLKNITSTSLEVSGSYWASAASNGATPFSWQVTEYN